jgi:hypothetical protein
MGAARSLVAGSGTAPGAVAGAAVTGCTADAPVAGEGR